MYLYSNEIVFRGHPDKICDQISDALLTEYLRQDKNSRCGIEVVGGKDTIFITGEVSSGAIVNVEEIVKKTLLNVGVNKNYQIINNIGIQSSDIAVGVDAGGAGDQGMMFGYACRDTKQKLPLAMVILQEFSKKYFIYADISIVATYATTDLNLKTAKEIDISNLPEFSSATVEYYLLDEEHDCELVNSETVSSDAFDLKFKMSLYSTCLIRIMFD